MSEKRFPADIDNLRSINKFLRLQAFVILLIALITSIGWYKSIGSERIVLVPPENKKTVWVDDQNVSNDYLEEMAYYMATQILNTTPETARYQGEKLMNYAAPEERGVLKMKIDENVTKIIAYGASTVFHPNSISIGSGKDALEVAMTGSMSTFIADKRVSEATKTFLIKFSYSSGKLHLKTFKEVNINDPFNESDSGNNGISFEVPRQQ